MLLSETALPDPIFALVPWVVFIPRHWVLINLLLGRRFGEKLVGHDRQPGFRRMPLWCPSCWRWH